MSPNLSLSTHVLDTTAGRPATGMRVQLDAATPEGWLPLVTTYTDHDGRAPREAFAEVLAASATTYRLVFDTAQYYADHGVNEFFYPEVVVCFTVPDSNAAGPGAHYHVPLLLSPFGFSTYRGS